VVSRPVVSRSSATGQRDSGKLQANASAGGRYGILSSYGLKSASYVRRRHFTTALAGGGEHVRANATIYPLADQDARLIQPGDGSAHHLTQVAQVDHDTVGRSVDDSILGDTWGAKQPALMLD